MIGHVAAAVGAGLLVLAVSFTFGWAIGTAIAHAAREDLHDVFGGDE